MEEYGRSGHPEMQRTDENAEKWEILFGNWGQKFIHAYYLEIVMTLNDSLHRKCLKSGPTIGFSILTRSLWPKKSIVGLEHYPHSPDLAPSDFLLFTKLKYPLKKWRIFGQQRQQHWWFYQEAEFHKCFQQWQHSQAKDVASKRDYFEGHLSH